MSNSRGRQVRVVSGILSNPVTDAIDSFDKDVGIKDTLGSLVLAGTDLASQLAGKVVELNDQYKVTDQIKAKIEESMEKSKTSS